MATAKKIDIPETDRTRPFPVGLPASPAEAPDSTRQGGSPKRWIEDGVSNAAYWLGTHRTALLLPLLPLAASLVVLLYKPAVLVEPVVIDLKLPSESAIAPEQPAPGVTINQDDIVWRFRYAPTGTEFRSGIPYWVYRVMPRIFDDKFKGKGYDHLGFGDDDHTYYDQRPVGRGLVLTDSTLNLPFLRIKTSIKRVAINCAGCHRGEYVGKDGKIVYVDGMPNHTADLQGFKRLFADSVLEDRFTSDRVITEINIALHEDGKDPLTIREATIYQGIVAAMKSAANQRSSAWMDLRADNGPGRIDPFNAVKFEIIGVPDDKSAAQIDFPSLWNQDAKIREFHHADGNTRSSRARNQGSALGVGAIPMSLNKKGIEAIGAWLDSQLPAPPYPFTPPAPAASARGLAIFTERCASCHGLYDRTARAVTQVEGSQYMARVKSGTDPERSKAFLKPAAEALNDHGERHHIWEKDAFIGASEQGLYLCGPLDSIWARAPYLHNGSVPTLADLLKPLPPAGRLDPAEAKKYRPRQFYRGNRRFDEKNVGWVSTEPTEGDRVLFLYRTVNDNEEPIPGNSNQGHEYGTDLGQEDRDALVEYLKTL